MKLLLSILVLALSITTEAKRNTDYDREENRGNYQDSQGQDDQNYDQYEELEERLNNRDSRNSNRGNSGGRNNGGKNNGRHGSDRRDDQNSGGQSNQNPDQRYQDNISDDAALVKAVENKQQVKYLQAANMVVVKVLPEDNQGLRHQKWVVKLSSGKTVTAVYNTSMCEEVPVQVGDVVGLGGHFLWTNQGPIIHWLHKDPKRNRPDGYVELAGKKYCFQ